MLAESADASFFLPDYQFQFLVEPRKGRMILLAERGVLIFGEFNEFFQDLVYDGG